MTGPKRSEFERERDFERITELYLKRKTQEEIAGIIGVDQSQISRDIATIKRRWKDSGLVNTDEAQKEKLSELALLKREHYIAWENSYGEHTKTRTEQSTVSGKKKKGKDDDDKSGVLKAVIEKETLLGNPAYLNGILNAIQEECKILGLYAPTKIAPTNPEGNEPYDAGFDETERAAKLIALLNAAGTRRDRQTAESGQEAVETIAGAAE